MEDIFEQLEQEGGLTKCEIFGMPWQPYTDTPFGRVLEVFEDLEPGPCKRQPTRMLWIRACPCTSKIKQRAREFNNSGKFPLTAGGLYVSQKFTCDTHARYFERRPYPFMCMTCGIVYEEFDSLVVREEAIL